MKAHPFQVGDKVTLRFNPGRLIVTPQLAVGRVYCVQQADTIETGWPDCDARVCLVGVRRHRRYQRTIKTDCLPACMFRLVSGASSCQQPQGGRTDGQ